MQDTYPIYDQDRYQPPIEEYRTNAVPMHIRNETYLFDTGAMLYDPAQIGIDQSESDTKLSIMAEIELPSKHRRHGYKAVVMESTDAAGKTRYAVGGIDTDKEGNERFNGKVVRLHPGRPLILGRDANLSDHADNLVPAGALWRGAETYDEMVSGNHATLEITDGILSLSDSSTHGTKLIGARLDLEHTLGMQPPANALNFTDAALRKARKHNLLVKSLDSTKQYFGMGKERHEIIDRETFPLDGKVEVRSWGNGDSFAVFIDSAQNPHIYKEFYRDSITIIREKAAGNRPTEREILEGISDTVNAWMNYDLDFVEDLELQMMRRDSHQRIVNLSTFLREGKAVCSQEALAAAWLGGAMNKNKLLTGKMTTEVSQDLHSLDAHEWARYTSDDGTVWIIDPTHGFVGTLEEVARDESLWDYFRPGEKAKYLIGAASIKYTAAA
jgi:hypothetical protein